MKLNKTQSTWYGKWDIISSQMKTGNENQRRLCKLSSSFSLLNRRLQALKWSRAREDDYRISSSLWIHAAPNTCPHTVQILPRAKSSAARQLSKYKEVLIWGTEGWTDGLVGKNTGCSSRDPSLVPGTHIRWPTTACNFSSRGANVLFWPQCAPTQTNTGI